jgi:stage II sporulation protein AB (anti-sigma F factor)
MPTTNHPPNSAGRLELELPAQPRSVASARHAVRDFCAGEVLDHQAVAIAVSEAVTNVVMHSYPAGVDGRVRLVATLQGTSLVITVADRGRGMRARAQRPGLGAGLDLIARLSNGVEIDDRSSGTTVTMRFDRGRADVKRFADRRPA